MAGRRSKTTARLFRLPVIALLVLAGNHASPAYSAPVLKIERVVLSFENGRPEATVNRNQAINAIAEIKSSGSGLLEGHWEVDGKMLAKASLHVTAGQSVRLRSPASPPLPTFDPGAHVVRFVITKPAEPASASILYFVVPGEAAYSVAGVKVHAPADGAEVGYSPLKFEWEKASGTASYLVSFYEKSEGKPVFSAFAKGNSYLLPGAVLERFFVPRGKYYWKLKGFDEGNRLIRESKTRSFTFRKRPD